MVVAVVNRWRGDPEKIARAGRVVAARLLTHGAASAWFGRVVADDSESDHLSIVIYPRWETYVRIQDSRTTDAALRCALVELHAAAEMIETTMVEEAGF